MTWAAGAALAVGVLVVAGCGQDGQIALTNHAGDDVVVDLGGEESVEVTADGGAVLHTDECYDGPIRVRYVDGSTVELGGPICPGQELVVRDGRAELVETASTD